MSNETNKTIKNLVPTGGTTQINEILPGYKTIDQFTKDGYKILMEAIRNSNSLPNGRDWNFYAAHESFNTIVSNEGNNVLKQLNFILRHNEIEGNIRNRVLEEKTELMIEANDMILEKVANNIDEMNGIKKTANEPVLIQTVSAQLPINGSWNRVNKATFSVSSSITSEHSRQPVNAIRLLTGKNIVRPQKFFRDKIVNTSKYPWEPRIKEKPNSVKPLAIFLEETQSGEEYSHPYEYELDRFTPSSTQLTKETPLMPCKVENTPLVEINQPEQVDELVETLRNCKEFAVDLEHHSYRSFMGITCLLQISTRDKDYLIDTLALRDKLYVLNEVFTNPSIVKIFHGADMDIQWLQRDLSLYVVNMFDTYQAAKQLGYSGLSLSYLMQKFCSFIPNKQFQLADWRMRPLPDELRAYAREDTHYLIYIYHMLKNELIDRANGQDNILLSVLKSSTETCKKRYFRPVLREDSHLDFYRKCKRLFDNRQLYALKELYKWRDHIAREEDESTGYVLPNHMLLQISEMLPREIQGILACCNPIPPLVRSNLLEIHQIVLRAKEQPLEKPILKEDTRARGTTLKISKVNVDSPLHCPHDLTKSGEFPDNLPTLLNKKTTEDLGSIVNTKLEIESNNSIYTLFDTPENTSDEETNGSELQIFAFLGPYERYKLVRPFIQAEEERLAAEEAKNEEKDKENSTSEGATQGDIRTDEERIESIRKHFLSLARKTVPRNGSSPRMEVVRDQSLVQMGGSKRKRELSLPEEPNYSSSGVDLQTTVPNVNTGSYNPRKRKSSDLLHGDGPNKIAKSNEKSFPNQKRKFKKKNGNKGQQMQNMLDQQENPQNVKKYNKNKQTNNYRRQQREHNQHSYDGQNQYHDGNRRDYDSEQGPNNVQFDFHQKNNRFYFDRDQPDANSVTNVKNKRRAFRGGRGGKQKNKQRGSNQQTANQADQKQVFNPYDYSSVDFRQFQGGAGGTQLPQAIKSTFIAKGKKRKRGNRGNNRSSTFANAGKRGARSR